MFINGGKIAYFLSSLVTEYWEFDEAKNIYLDMINNSEKYSDEELNKQLLELKYEIIDQFHFLMNMLIYGRIPKSYIETFNLQYEFDYTNESPLTVTEEESICLLIANLGEYLNKYPYKTWKKQRYTKEQLENIPEEIDNIVTKILKSFFNFTRYWINDEKEFWSLYYTKNLENIERQKNKDKGYIK
jgi:hypothetical protein